MNIYLIGFRGTGKTTVAPLIAERLGDQWSSVDMDAELELQAGRSIQQVFDEEGENGFRDREQAVLAHMSVRDGLVVATGGGVVLRPENRQRLHCGFVAWLAASPDTIETRLRRDPITATRRPALTGATAIDEVRQVLAVREPLYRALADVTFSTDRLAPTAIADAIAEAAAMPARRRRGPIAE